MNIASEFAKSAARMASYILTGLSKDDQNTLASLSEKGFNLGISFIVSPGSNEPGKIQLSTVDEYGTHKVIASVQLNAVKHH